MDIIKWADSSAWCIGKILNSLFPIAVSSMVEKVAGSVLVSAKHACRTNQSYMQCLLAASHFYFQSVCGFGVFL